MLPRLGSYSHHLPGVLTAAAGGGAHDGDGEGVVLKHGLVLVEANLNLSSTVVLVPGLACCLVRLSPRLSWTDEVGEKLSRLEQLSPHHVSLACGQVGFS